MSTAHLTDYGFTWGPWEVVRCFEHERGYFIDIVSEEGCRVELHLTPKGKKARVMAVRGDVVFEDRAPNVGDSDE